MHPTLSKERYESDTPMTSYSDVAPRRQREERFASPPRRNRLPPTPTHAYVKRETIKKEEG